MGIDSPKVNRQPAFCALWTSGLRVRTFRTI
jgi:hypothetical protein